MFPNDNSEQNFISQLHAETWLNHMRRKCFFLALVSKFTTNKASTTGGSVHHLSVPLLNQSVSSAPVLCHRQQTWPTGSSCSRCGGRGLCQETGSTSADNHSTPTPPRCCRKSSFSFTEVFHCVKNKSSLLQLVIFLFLFFTAFKSNYLFILQAHHPHHEIRIDFAKTAETSDIQPRRFVWSFKAVISKALHVEN